MKKTILGITIIAALTTPLLAFSQETTEVGKLKQRLMALEQKLYSGNNNSSGTMLADFEARLGNLEEESQKVYGAVEELGYTVDEFAKKMELISKDLDLRISDLEEGFDKLKAQAENLKSSKMEIKSKKEQISQQAEKPTKPITQTKVSQNLKEPKVKQQKQAVKSKVSRVSIPKNISAEDLYSKAYHLLVATSYNDAEKWMKEFLKRYPANELADNAHYWLGEIYLIQEKPEKAVVSFSTGLAKFPKGAKAAANLLKMGKAFKQMGKVEFAESSWKKLIKDFKNSPEADKAIKMLDKLKVEKKS